jgi:NTP pyrophosphatase (non-canonical NTP hydrolase)
MKKSKPKTQIQQLTKRANAVMRDYKRRYPDVKIDRDYLPFKITEEWGECLQVYLMLTNRGRQKGKKRKEIQKLFSEEFADVFAFLLLFADKENVDIVESMTKKWFKYLKNKN